MEKGEKFLNTNVEHTKKSDSDENAKLSHLKIVFKVRSITRIPCHLISRTPAL